MTTAITNIQAKISAARFEYEYLGKTAQEIATAYGFPLASVHAEIETEGWERKISPTVLPDTSDIQDFANQLETITRSKLSIISLFRQIEQQPLLAEIEKTMLAKILELTDSIEALDDRAASKLLNLTKAVDTIQSRNPVQLADAFREALRDAGSSGQGVIVNIANQIQ